jgi:uncharacterized protein (DUF1697 family)
VTRHVALLRGINIGPHNRVAMPELRTLCAELGWADAQTYVQSGNVVFVADGAAKDLAAQLEAAIARRLGLDLAVVVRNATSWDAYVRGNPLAGAAAREPNLVMLALARATMLEGAGAEAQAYAAGGERVVQTGDALWLHLHSGVGRSKLTPQRLEKLAGSPVTMRNWRTVLAIDHLLRAGS